MSKSTWQEAFETEENINIIMPALKSTTLTAAPKQPNHITRIEVIGLQGREFTKMLATGSYEISIQDDGRTIKLFEKQPKE